MNRKDAGARRKTLSLLGGGEGGGAWLDEVRTQLDGLASQGLRRQLRFVECPDGVNAKVDGRPMTLFCSNDYLGLAGDDRLAKAAFAAAEKYGFGAGASRLISGNSPSHEELEAALSRFHKAESALLFASGFQGNLAVVGALAGKGDTVVVDRLAHASLVDAARLSGATLKVFPHNDAEALGSLLRRRRRKTLPLSGGGEGEGSKKERVLVLTESVFSMDGDTAPLKDLVRVCGKHGAVLLVDEAHATGVWAEGRGRCVEEGIENQPSLLRTGTLSKALGGQGGYLLGPKAVRDLVINRGRSLIYSTALAPALCGAGLEALRIAQAEPERREKLWKRTRQLRSQVPLTLPSPPRGRGNSELSPSPLKGEGREGVVPSAGPIIPVILGSSEKALDAARSLWDLGFFVPAIRPPTVPKGSARLRITLSASHTEDQVLRLASLLASMKP